MQSPSFAAPGVARSARTTARVVAMAFLASLVLLSSSLLTRRAAEAAVSPTAPLRDRAEFGAYVPDLPGSLNGLRTLEGQLGAKLQLASSFTDWSYIFGNDMDRAMADGGTRKVLYSWEPFGIRFSTIANGGYDAYLQRVADSMKRYPHDIYVRPWGEMNANWSSWQPTPGGEKRDGGTPAEFIAAWRHTVSFFRSRGVNNLKFVYNPDAADFGNNTRIPTIWPGAEYVDVLGIDGYNWGYNAATGDTWREFDVIFENMYNILTGLHPTAPVWIAEFGSKEPAYNDGAPADARSKGQWFTNMMSTTKFPRLTALAYFNVRKERDWRIESSTESLNALKAQLALRGSTPTAPTTTTPTTAPPTTKAPTTTAPTTAPTTKPPTTTAPTTKPPTTAPVTATAPVALQNASLEADANRDGTPDCFTFAGYGTNTPKWTWTINARTGINAMQLDVSSYVDGDRKVVTAQDATCAPVVTPGTTYNTSVWYRSTAPANVVTYYRNAAGAWVYWTTSPTVPAASGWTQARYTTPAVPAGATAISFGLALSSNGTLTVDDFGLTRNVRNLVANASLETDANGDSVPDGFATAGYGTNTATWARVTDARTGRFAQRVTVTGYSNGDRKLVPDMVQPGAAPAAVAGTRYTVGVAYKSTVPVALVTYYKDGAGVWQYWQSGATVPARSTYGTTSLVTPPVPAGATVVSFGVALSGNGTLTVDDFSMTA